MKTSSAPRSSSVSPLQERSTSAFSELSAVTMETEKQTKNQTISAQFIENNDAQLLFSINFSFYTNQLSSIFSNRNYVQIQI